MRQVRCSSRGGVLHSWGDEGILGVCIAAFEDGCFVCTFDHSCVFRYIPTPDFGPV